MNSEPIIELQGVGKDFRRYRYGKTSFLPALFRGFRQESIKQTVLEDINLSVLRGEKVALIGDNGAGKSTLLRVLAGILRQDRGDVKVEGSVLPILQTGLGFCADLTGVENIFLAASILGVTRAEVVPLLDSIIGFAELQDWKDSPLQIYSGGMISRLGFSLACHLQADILVLDEALSAGDAAFQKKARARLRELLQKKDLTWLIASHNLVELQQICNRAILLRNGRIVKVGSVEQVLTEYWSQYETRE